MTKLRKMPEPDWKERFFALAVHVASARAFLRVGAIEPANNYLEKAAQIIAVVTNTPSYAVYDDENND